MGGRDDLEAIVEEAPFSAALDRLQETHPEDVFPLKSAIDWTLAAKPDYGDAMRSDPNYRIFRVPGFAIGPEYRVLYRYCTDDPHPRVALLHLDVLEPDPS